MPDLVEIVVAKRHGQDAIAAYEGIGHSGKENTLRRATRKEKFQKNKDGKFPRQRPMHIVRGGKKIPYAKESKRWTEAREQILTALSKGELVAFVRLTNGTYTPVDKDYWQGEDAWRALENGIMEKPEFKEQADRPVYLEHGEVVAWLETLTGEGASPPDSSLQKMQDGRVKPDTQKKYIEWWAAAQEIRGDTPFDSKALAGKVESQVGAKSGTVKRTLDRFFPGWSG